MGFINLHTHHHTNTDILELVNQYPDTFVDGLQHYSIGIHPWRINDADVEAQLDFIEQKMIDTACLAVGECGLDKRIEIPLAQQLPVFEAQLRLAEQYCKPVIIHCVAAFQEVIALKKEIGISVPMVVHGFSKNSQVAQSLLDNGFYLSFGKYLLRNPELSPVFTAVPNSRFFLETDTIEEDISQVYEVAAGYKDISLEDLKEIVKTNFLNVFSNNTA
ncbi:MAG: hydrolase TatD [Flavobacterium sp. BFFFF1]|uniref:TatD family hydrolase n=1 Tax=Flavobacterium sp. BFFFF1 TaxID=2015557 RepID=UPI000BC58C61|nr:TatD family hydrolase [Flavobacterium sp. BFFFF1]OYU79112.1 MAG: hydrolase TatD [Flavobacterium sp. BFFFF1]